MVEFWMGAYDCCRASPTVVRSAEAVREIIDWEIGYLGDNGFVHCEIAISETPMSGGQLSA